MCNSSLYTSAPATSLYSSVVLLLLSLSLCPSVDVDAVGASLLPWPVSLFISSMLPSVSRLLLLPCVNWPTISRSFSVLNSFQLWLGIERSSGYGVMMPYLDECNVFAPHVCAFVVCAEQFKRLPVCRQLDRKKKRKRKEVVRQGSLLLSLLLTHV